MTRLTMVFAAFVCFLPAASASLSPKSDLPSPGKDLLSRAPHEAPVDLDKPPNAAAAPVAEDKSDQPHFVLTTATEVQLDGQACKLEDVPPTASVVNLEIAADKKTVVKIFFQSKK